VPGLGTTEHALINGQVVRVTGLEQTAYPANPSDDLQGPPMACIGLVGVAALGASSVGNRFEILTDPNQPPKFRPLNLDVRGGSGKRPPRLRERTLPVDSDR